MRLARPFAHRRFRPSRHSVHLPCQVVRESDFRLVADRIDNLSTNGLMVTPADPVLTGERLIVSFKAPLSRRYIDAECVVARVAHGRRPGETTRGIGLWFEQIDGFSRRLLEANLPWWPVAPPSWRPGRRDGAGATRHLAEASGGIAPHGGWVRRARSLAPLTS